MMTTTTTMMMMMMSRVSRCDLQTGFGLMTGFIARLYNSSQLFANRSMTHYVFSSPSSSTAVSRDSVTLRMTVSHSVKSWCRTPSTAHDQLFITLWQLRSCFCGASSLTRGRVCLLYMLLALASVAFLGSCSFWVVTIFYCLRFETSLFVASHDSQGHGGGIRTRLHTGPATPSILLVM
jgi:hypothetical protein